MGAIISDGDVYGDNDDDCDDHDGDYRDDDDDDNAVISDVKICMSKTTRCIRCTPYTND